MENPKHAWYKSWWAISLFTFLTILLIFLVAFGFYFFDLVKRAGSDLKQQDISAQLQGKKYQAEGKNNFYFGPKQAKITIVEFADFACQYCKNSFSTIREISQKYPDNIKLIFRDFPMHENSLALAMAARCAGEQGLFWLMHDKLYQYQGVSTTDQLMELANQIGADLARFKDCFTKQKYLSQIQQDVAEGVKFDLTGTPTWFINGYKVEGEIPYGTFIKLIEELIK